MNGKGKLGGAWELQNNFVSMSFGEYMSAILAGGLRNWLINHKVPSVVQTGLVKGKRTFLL
jgi:hypothetical protein